MPGLSPKQRRFVEEYLVDLNATQAAIRAGYSAKTAEQQGSRLLRNAQVQEAVSAGQVERAERTGITADRVLTELAKIGFANMGDYLQATSGGDPFFAYEGLTRDQKASLAEVTVEDFKEGRGEDARDVRKVKFKLHDKRAALVDLGRHLGLFTDKVEHKGGLTVEVVRFSDANPSSG